MSVIVLMIILIGLKNWGDEDFNVCWKCLRKRRYESLNKTLKRQEMSISGYDSKNESAAYISRSIDPYNLYRQRSSFGWRL